MAVLFFFSAVSKLQGDDWWSGDAVWVVFTTNEHYNRFALNILASQYWLVNFATYATIIIELAYVFLIWQRRTRLYLLLDALLLHVMFAILMGLFYFSFVMMMGHMSFIYPEWLTRLGEAWKRRFGDMEMIYDGRCGFCYRSMVWFLSFDGLGQIRVRISAPTPPPWSATREWRRRSISYCPMDGPWAASRLSARRAAGARSVVADPVLLHAGVEPHDRAAALQLGRRQSQPPFCHAISEYRAHRRADHPWVHIAPGIGPWGMFLSQNSLETGGLPSCNSLSCARGCGGRCGKGDSIAHGPSLCRRVSFDADHWRIIRPRFLNVAGARKPPARRPPRSRFCRRRPRRGRARRCGHLRRREAARRRVFADRAGWTVSPPNRATGMAARPISGSPRSLRRPPARGTRRCGRRARRVRHHHARHYRQRPKAAAAVHKEGSIWPVNNNWNRATENLFSAWIEKLFDAPLDAEPSWKVCTRCCAINRAICCSTIWGSTKIMRRNPASRLRRLLYFLRAYFAFKMGLPFGYSNCSRGGGGAADAMLRVVDILHPETRPAPPPEQLAAARRRAAPHRPLQLVPQQRPPAAGPPPPSAPAPPKKLGLGAVRPISAHGRRRRAYRFGANGGRRRQHRLLYRAADRGALRPGTVYADPYGHVLMIVRRVPQSGGGAGVFLAVDGEPDGTVARKRFWRGNFLFAQEPALGGPGFKRFRPIVRDKNGGLRRLTNAEIEKSPQYGDFSLEQTQLRVEDFYDRMDDVMSPAPLDPSRAMKEVIASLEEQVKARVTSVENGRKFQAAGRRCRACRTAPRFRDHRRVGRFRHAGARLPSLDRDRRGARVPRPRRPPNRALCDAQRTRASRR